MSNRVITFDTTLHDDEQSPGVTMNLQEKLHMVRQLESLGVDAIEAGFPAPSMGDFEAVHTIANTVIDVQVVAFVRCNKNNIGRIWQALGEVCNPRTHVFPTVSPIHMEYRSCETLDQVVGMAIVTVHRATKYTNNAGFSVEDASRPNPGFLVHVFAEVINAGATTTNVLDIVGYAQSDEYGKLIKYVIENTLSFHRAMFSVRCHDDLGLTVINGLSTVQNGARQAEVTLYGIGERASNAPLEKTVMAMKIRLDVYGADCDIRNEQLYPVCRLLSFIVDHSIAANRTIVGSSTFAHESGIHQDDTLKNRETYKIMTPQSIDRKSADSAIGKHPGCNAVRIRLEELGCRLDDEQVSVVFAAVKDPMDRKANVHDEDSEALVFSEAYRPPNRYRLGDVSVQTIMGSPIPATTVVVIQTGEEETRHVGFGAGPIDMTLSVTSQIVSRVLDLEQFSINVTTGGTDVQGGAIVYLREGEYSVTGRSSDPDIIVASARAYTDVLNHLDHKERDALYTQEATDEPATNTRS